MNAQVRDIGNYMIGAGMCRYAWAINQSEGILNKMTKVVRVNLIQDSS